MLNIAARQAAVTVAVDGIDREPTAAEVDSIEREMPVILARVDLIDSQITTLDRTPSELDTQRIRRARRRLLAARRTLANRTAGASLPGGAA